MIKLICIISTILLIGCDRHLTSDEILKSIKTCNASGMIAQGVYDSSSDVVISSIKCVKPNN